MVLQDFFPFHELVGAPKPVFIPSAPEVGVCLEVAAVAGVDGHHDMVAVDLVDIAAQDSNVDPARQVALIADELVRFSPELAVRERWLVLNKKDLLSGEEFEHRMASLVENLQWKGKVFAISALTGEGVEALIQALMERLEQLGHRFSHAVEVESSPDEEEPWDPLSER